MAYRLHKYGGVIRLTDGAFVPECEGNRDWLKYREWTAAGNTPAPAETPEEIADREAYETKIAAIATAIEENLPPWRQVSDAIDACNSVAALRAVVKRIALITYINTKNDIV